jgi:hypothetical protein
MHDQGGTHNCMDVPQGSKWKAVKPLPRQRRKLFPGEGSPGEKTIPLCPGNQVSMANGRFHKKALVAYVAVEETGHPAAVVARFLGISRMGVQKAVITCPPSRAKGPLRRGGRGGREFGRHEVSLER